MNRWPYSRYWSEMRRVVDEAPDKSAILPDANRCYLCHRTAAECKETRTGFWVCKRCHLVTPTAEILEPK